MSPSPSMHAPIDMLAKFRSNSTNPSPEYASLPTYNSKLDDPILNNSVPKRAWLGWKLVALGELLLITALLLCMPHLARSNSTNRSLVAGVLTYGPHTFSGSIGRDRTPYQGTPSPDVDRLWSNLYEGAIFKISSDEARLLPNRTSAIPGDTGHYVSSLSVFHHLHCLNFMRKTMWPDYYPDFDLRDPNVFEHQEHCIDILRQAHMCNPDITAAIYQWDPVAQESVVTWDIQHTCVDFDAIHMWAKNRALSHYDTSIYVDGNPILQTH